MPDEATAKCQGFYAYYEHVNIELYNDIVAFVMATTAAEARQVHRELSSKHLWYRESNNDNIQAHYGFRYFGELLERFEDKAGSDIRDLRAIALALADTKELFTDDMFVGSQKNNFIKKITRLSVGDVYLKGALYLLKKDDANGDYLLELLTKSAYDRTEELIFAMSLYDEFERAFLTCKPWIYKLLCKTRTLPVAGNIEIYCWLIKRLCYCDKLKEIRTKDMALFRAFMELPIAFVKEGNRHNKVLLENGFTAEDIIYLNSAIVRRRPISDTIYVDSITAEKIAVAMCTTFINSEETHSPDVYEHLEWVLKKYKTFSIKLTGYQGIYQAIQYSIRIKNPQTFTWLYNKIEERDVFRFDVLDTKWDALSKAFEPVAYRELFQHQLSKGSELTKEQIIERLEKYSELTGLSYVSEFEREYTWRSGYDFAMLVEKGILDIPTTFTSYMEANPFTDKHAEKGNGPPLFMYISKYIKGIVSKESFNFFKYFFSKYNFDDMQRFFVEPNYNGHRDISGFFKDMLYEGPSRYSGDDSRKRFKIERSFLTDEEHRELFGWLDDYMLQFSAEDYIDFAVLMLIDSFVSTLFPHDELREIYDKIHGLDINTVNKNIKLLKNKYMTEAEVQAERDDKIAREEEAERQEYAQQVQNLKDGLTSIYDGSFNSLLKYFDKYHQKFDDFAEIIPIVVAHIEIALSCQNHTLSKNELGWFMQFSGKLLKRGYIDFDTLKGHITVIKEEPENVETEDN